MASVVQKPNGKWLARWDAPPIDGKRRRHSRVVPAGNEKDALRQATLLEAAHTGVVISGVTVGEALDAWLERAKGRLEERSWIEAERRARCDVKPLLGSMPVEKLDPDGVERFHDALLRKQVRVAKGAPSRTMSPQSVRHAHYALSGAMKMAVRRGWITANPCDAAEPPPLKKRTVKAPTPAQLRVVLGWCDAQVESDAMQELGLVIRISAATGARLGEVMALQWTDVNPAGTIRFVRALSDLTAPRSDQLRGRRLPRKIVVKLTKTGAGGRVDVPVQLIERLRDWRERQQVAFGETTGSVWVFPGLFDPGLPLGSQMMSARFKNLQRKMRSLDPPVAVSWSLRGLRHFSATNWIKAGIPVPDVSVYLRHGRPSTTSDQYWEFTDDDVQDRRASDVMTALLGDVL